MKKIILMVGVVLFFSACSTNLGTFNLVSTNNVPIQFEENDYITGESCFYIVLFIPIGDLTNRLTLATMNALENAHKKGIKAHALKHVRYNINAWSAGLFGRQCVEVKGQVVTFDENQENNQNTRRSTRTRQ